MARPASDIIFHVDIHDERLLSWKHAVKIMNGFIKSHEKQAPGSKYGIVLFSKVDANPIILDHLVKSDREFDHLLTSDVRPCCSETSMEHGIMIALHYIVERFKVAGDRTQRIIVISTVDCGEQAGRDPEHVMLARALIDLLEPVKYFPVYIDIVVVVEGDLDPVTGNKLRFITATCNGRLARAGEAREVEDALDQLIEEPGEWHAVEEGAGLLPPSRIPEAHKTFFEHMCFPLVPGPTPGRDTCADCEGVLSGGGKVVACGRCGATYHEGCTFSLAATRNIGFVHLFRCKQCDGLLATDEVRLRESLALPPVPGSRNDF